MSRKVWPVLLLLLVNACGDDDGGGSEAQRRGVGAECDEELPCEEQGQECLAEFAGGYCGVRDCESDEDCPGGSACVTGGDLVTSYCFLICLDKPDCNLTRSVENEANCVSSLEFVDPQSDGIKVCRPPNSG
jgi:hypothetical protein